MKFRIFSATLLLASLFFIITCKKAEDSSSIPDIYSSWTVLQTDAEGQIYNVELKFNTDNTFDWILLDSVEGHSNSHIAFELVDNIMYITQDTDCSSQGEYYILEESNKLAIIAIEDYCEPRAEALEYLWEKKTQ
jgi:hypothetical protein